MCWTGAWLIVILRRLLMNLLCRPCEKLALSQHPGSHHPVSYQIACKTNRECLCTRKLCPNTNTTNTQNEHSAERNSVNKCANLNGISIHVTCDQTWLVLPVHVNWDPRSATQLFRPTYLDIFSIFNWTRKLYYDSISL